MFIISLTFMSLLFKVQCRIFEYAVLAADSSTQSEEFCLYVEPTISFPKQKSESKSYILRNNEEINWCIDSNKTNCVNEVLLLPADNCSISTQVDNFLNMSGEVIVFVSEDPLDPLDFEETKCLNKTGIPTLKISERSAKMLKEMGRTVGIKLFKPDGLELGYFYPILWLLSVFAVVLISHWSGFKIYKRLEQEWYLKPFNIFKDKDYAILFLRIAVYVLMLVIYSLHGSYIFKTTILDVLSIMSSSMPLFLCLDFLTGNLKHYLKFSFTICNISMDICETLINWFISITISTLWILCCGMKYTWLLENVLSIAFYGTLIYGIPFISLQFCLCVLYMDICLKILFILSGYLDSNGMEFIHGEPAIFRDCFLIPIYIQVKDIGFDPLRACRRVFMVVDVMDLAVFGLTLSYCYVLDLLTNKKRLYYIIMVISYCLVRFLKDFLVLQFEVPLCAPFIMPAVFIPPVILALYRNEFPLLCDGFEGVKKMVEQKRKAIELTAKESNEQSEENTEVVDFV